MVADLYDLYPGYENLLPNVDFLITSRDIPARLTGEADLRKSLPEVAKRYRCQLAAATLGEEGRAGRGMASNCIMLRPIA